MFKKMILLNIEPFKDSKPFKGLGYQNKPTANTDFVAMSAVRCITTAQIRTHCAKVQLPKQQL
jgi:hypothetical protein